MRRFYPLIVCLALLLGSCARVEERAARLTVCASMPAERTGAVAFAIGDKAYVWGGRDEKGALSNSLFCYDAATDSWTALGTTPLAARVSATAIVVDGKAYVGLGFTQGIYQAEAYLRDWWRYDPITNTWDSLAAYPATNTVGGICYREEQVIYYAYGFSTGFGAAIYRYDTATDSWSELKQTHRRMLSVMAPAGGSIGGRHFIGSGYRTEDIKAWYEIDWQGDWIERASIPGARNMAVCTAGSAYLYLAGGRLFHGEQSGGRVYDDVLRYDPAADQWTLAAHLPTGAEHMIGFTLGGKAYIGLGEAADGTILNTLYRIDE